MTAIDNIYKYFCIVFFFFFFLEKIRLDISQESSAGIHMKHQALLSSNDKSKKINALSVAVFVWHFKDQFFWI